MKNVQDSLSTAKTIAEKRVCQGRKSRNIILRSVPMLRDPAHSLLPDANLRYSF